MVCVAHVRVGEVISCTTMVALHVAELPQVSVAVQVLVVLYVLAQEPGVVISEKVKVIPPPQESTTVGGTNIGVEGQLIGVVCVPQVTDGGATSGHTISAKLTVSETAAFWPVASVTVTVAT